MIKITFTSLGINEALFLDLRFQQQSHSPQPQTQSPSTGWLSPFPTFPTMLLWVMNRIPASDY